MKFYTEAELRKIAAQAREAQVQGGALSSFYGTLANVAEQALASRFEGTGEIVEQGPLSYGFAVPVSLLPPFVTSILAARHVESGRSLYNTTIYSREFLEKATLPVGELFHCDVKRFLKILAAGPEEFDRIRNARREKG